MTEKLRLFTTNQSRLRQSDAAPAWRKKMTNLSKFHFKTEKNDLNKKPDAKILKQNDVNQNLQTMNKSHAKTKNDKK